MKISHLRYLLWLFYVMPPALGRPTPPPPPPPPDHVHEPPAEDDCPQQDPPVFFQTQADEFAIDIAIASRNDERTWTNVSGYFRVVVNPTSHTIRSVGSEIYQVTGPPGRDRQRISPTFTPYIAHAYRTPTQSIYADRWEIGIDSEEEVIRGSLGSRYRWHGAHPRVDMMITRERTLPRNRHYDTFTITWENFRRWARGVWLVHAENLHGPNQHCG